MLLVKKSIGAITLKQKNHVRLIKKQKIVVNSMIKWIVSYLMVH